MYGQYNLRIKASTEEDDEVVVEKCNHLTRRGLSFILKGDPKIVHADLIGPDFDNFRKQLNFMFLYIKQEGQELRIKDEDIFAMEFPDLNDPYIRYVDKGYSRYSDIYSFEGKESVTIEGIGIGYKEVGGTGENDFIFSYTNLGIDPTNYRTNVINATNYNNVVMPGWSVNVNYDFRPAVDALPNIKVDIGGVLHTLINTTFDSAGYWGDDRYGVGLFNQTIPVAQSPVNVSGMKTTFEWAINGLPLIPASLFEELVITDEVSRQLSRVFKVQYLNKRDFAVHVTGFKLLIGDIPFTYRTDADQPILLPAGKTLTLTLAAEIFLGRIPATNTSTFNTIDKVVANDDYFNVDETVFSEYTQTDYPGTAKEKIVTKAISSTYVYFTGATDALVKVVFKTSSGRTTKPYYFLGKTNPTSYSFSAPALTSVDGWVINNDDVVFRITAPAGVTHIEFALPDNVWTRYAVTASAVNFIKLPSRFLYNGTKYLRWANAVSTGLITRHTAKYLSDNNVLPIEYVYGDDRAPYLVGYSAGLVAQLPIGYTTAPTYVDDSTLLTTLTGGVVDTFADEACIALNKYGVISTSATFIGPLPNSKWFDAINMKLVTVAKMDTVVSVDKHDKTNPGGLVETNYKINPTSVSTLIATKISAYPKISRTRLYKSPTVALPNEFAGHLSANAYSIELYNSITNEVLATYTGKPSSEFTLTTTAMMYSHIAYGLRYLDELGQNISAGQEHFTYGVALAAPSSPNDVVYDTELNLLTFTTPDRATRATISRWGIELYSFECIIGGTTSLYSSETFVATGNYVLTLLNSENTKSEPLYIFGLNEDPAIKPDITGPYNFSDWSYSSSNYTNETALPFAQPEWYEQGLYKLRIDGVPARVVLITRNISNLITRVLFEANGSMLSWSTGYSDTDVSYKQASSSSSIRLIKHNGNGYCVVELWHEFGLYSEIGIDKIGLNRSNGWIGSYGKTANWYQFTDISNGYVRNSLKLLLRPNTNDSSPVPFQYDTSFTAKSPYANIYPHTTDVKDSPNYNPSRNSYSFNIGWEAYINGVKGAFESTFAEDGITIIKIRAFTTDIALILDMYNKAAGWLLEGFDPLKVGDPAFKDLAISFELHYTNKWFYTSYVGQYPNGSGYDSNANSPVRVKSSYYLDQIYTKFYPYMILPTISDVFGTSAENIGYDTNTDASNQMRNRWSEAYLSGNISSNLTNTSVVINRQLATVTVEEVTIPYDPTKGSLISQYQYEQPIESGAFNNVIQPVLGEYTYDAVTFTIPGLVISNKKHPNILQIVENTLPDPNVQVNVVMVRNKVLQPGYSFDYWSGTRNTNINRSVNSGSNYFNYTVVALYPTYPPIMRNSDSVGTYESPFEQVQTATLSSLYILANAVKGMLQAEGFVLPETNTYTDTVQINDEAFDIVIESSYQAWLLDSVNTPLPVYAFKLTNVDNTKEIIFSPYVKVEYIGFPTDVDIEIIVGLFTDNGNADIVGITNDYYNNINTSPIGEMYQVDKPALFGYNRSSFWNYIPHVIATGQQGLKVSLKTKTLAPTTYDPDFVIPDRTVDILSRYNTSFESVFHYKLNPDVLITWDAGGIPDLTSFNDMVSVYCNGVKSAPFVWYIDEEGAPIYLSAVFESLGLKLYIQPGNNIGLYDLRTDDDLSRDELSIFTIESKGLSLTANDSPIVLGNGIFDTASYNVFGKTSGFYNDVNGTTRTETLYMVTGLKPTTDVPIDSRIGPSPFPAFGNDSFIYATNISSSNNEEAS